MIKDKEIGIFLDRMRRTRAKQDVKWKKQSASLIK